MAIVKPTVMTKTQALLVITFILWISPRSNQIQLLISLSFFLRFGRLIYKQNSGPFLEDNPAEKAIVAIHSQQVIYDVHT
jgi:hypothetical protein